MRTGTKGAGHSTTLKFSIWLYTMRVRLVTFVVVFVLFAVSLRGQYCPLTGSKPGSWSKLSSAVCYDQSNDQLHLKVLSPDKQKSVLVEGRHADHQSLFISSNGVNIEKLQPAFLGIEVLWSPDSRGLALTICSGSSGPCGTRTTLDGGRESLSDIVTAAFSAGHKADPCYTEANVGALTWEQGSEKIVLIAEVPPSPQCNGHHDGYFEAFVVSVRDGKILSRVSMQETVHRWHSILGSRLRSDIKLVREDGG